MDEIESLRPESIFRNSSTTYFNSSIFFPPALRSSITTLYAFVRVADNYVDAIPQDKAGFEKFAQDYNQSYRLGDKTNHIIDNFVELQNKFGFEPEWADAFLDSMRMDLTKKIYHTINEVEEYIYGSAVVISYFLCRMLGIPDIAFPYAKKLAESMQFINMIRDVNEDLELGRIYIPEASITYHGISEFTKEAIMNRYQNEFIALIRGEIDRYFGWQKEAEQGFKFIPKRSLIAIKTASDLYKWTARVIYNNPMVVFERKVKPSKLRVIVQGLWNTVRI